MDEIEAFLEECRADSFFQSHPEYQSDTLLMEYRRDVIRFLRGETGTYPNVPQGYFDPRTEQGLLNMQQEITAQTHEAAVARLLELLSSAEIRNSWHEIAGALYGNWLQYISAEKKACIQKKRAETGAILSKSQQSILDPLALVSS